MNSDDTGVLIRLLSLTPKNAKDKFSVPHISKQVKRTKKWRICPIQDAQYRLGSEFCQRLLFIHYSFMYLMVATRRFVLMECQKSWTTWSLVNVRIHSPTWILIGKMSLRQEISLWNSWLVAMTVQRYKEFKTKFLKENVLVKAETFTVISWSTK